jgi:hypothetical protein
LTFLDFFPSTHHLEALAFFIPKTKAWNRAKKSLIKLIKS